MQTPVSHIVKGRNDFFVDFNDSCENIAFVREYAYLWAASFIRKAVHHELVNHI